MSEFQPAVDFLLSHESGELVANDNGRGVSKWGITYQTAKAIYPQCKPEDIARMDRDQAANFYRIHFWERYRIGLIQDQALANKAFDLLVNMGAGGIVFDPDPQNPDLKVSRLVDGALTILQRCAGVVVDGILGPESARVINLTNPTELLGAYCREAARHYQDLVQKNPALQKDLNGWLTRVNA